MSEAKEWRLVVASGMACIYEGNRQVTQYFGIDDAKFILSQGEHIAELQSKLSATKQKLEASEEARKKAEADARFNKSQALGVYEQRDNYQKRAEAAEQRIKNISTYFYLHLDEQGNAMMNFIERDIENMKRENEELKAHKAVLVEAAMRAIAAYYNSTKKELLEDALNATTNQIRSE